MPPSLNPGYFCMLHTHLLKICCCGTAITRGRISFAPWIPPMLVIEGLMLFTTTGKDFTLVTLLTTDWTPQHYLLPGEWSTARGDSCSSRLLASTEMGALYMTLNRSNIRPAWYKPIPPPPPLTALKSVGEFPIINLIPLTSYRPTVAKWWGADALMLL